MSGMSDFIRLSTGVAFYGRRSAPSNDSGPLVFGSTYFLRFGTSGPAPRSERIEESPLALRGLSFGGYRSRNGASSAADAYWSAPWRFPFAPRVVRLRMTPPITWRRREGM